MCYYGDILICAIISKHYYTRCACLQELKNGINSLLPLGGDLLKIMNADSILPDLLISV